MVEKDFGPNHPAVAWTLGNLANVYSEQDRYAEAETLYKRSISIVEKAFGPEHPHFVQGLTNHGRIYVDQGRYVDAARLKKNVLREEIKLNKLEYKLTSQKLYSYQL